MRFLSFKRGVAWLSFAAGLLGGALIGPALQGRTAPAVAAPAGEPGPSAETRATPSLPADVLRVLDGDTYEARVHVWPGLDITTKVRLRGIDAPELRPLSVGADQGRGRPRRVRDLLAEGSVGVYRISLDKYGGRVVADTTTVATADVSAEMLRRGLARSYNGGHRDGWCDDKP